MSNQPIAVRFARETAAHEMLILHDAGLYRHVKFRAPKHGWNMWFELITTPGTLIFRGDGESYVFNRELDMFEWFRTSAWKGRPNLGYWAEKLTSTRRSVKCYDQDLLAARVCEAVAEYYENEPMPDGLRDAVQEDVLDELVGDESTDRQTVESFDFYLNEKDRFDPFKDPDFRFHDVWEWRTQDYDWWFEWACQAIVWGIEQYNAHKNVSRWQRIKRTLLRRNGNPIPCAPIALTDAELAKSQNDRVWGTAPRVVDVHLPEFTEVPA